jgi:hypothetical protein
MTVPRLIVTAPSSSYELPPEGPFAARLFSIIDFGKQETPFGAKRQAYLGFEIAEKSENGELHTVSKRYTWSLHEKSAFRPVAEALLDRKFTGHELKYGFDVGSLVGGTCLVTIEHKPKKSGDGMRADIKSVSRLPKSMTAPPPMNAKRLLWLVGNGWSNKLFGELPEWMQKTIEASPEYQHLWAPKPPTPSPVTAVAPQPTIAEDLNDKIPF